MSGRGSTARRSLPARVLVLLIGVYQRISALTPPRCRFAPTCSAYAVEALTQHGALRGTWLALRRVVRCHPFNAGGVDHVPQPRSSRQGVGS
jgi:uncharacterized protein